MAVAHSILVIADDRLTWPDPEQDLGPDSFDRRDAAERDRRLIGQVHSFGYTVTKDPEAA